MNSATIRYGDQGLLSVKRVLQAGALSARLMEDGSLRYIKFNGTEIVRSLYAAFRDENWGTVQVRLDEMEIEQTPDAFTVRFRADHRRDAVLFAWTGTITGSSDGSLQYVMDGQAYNDFLKNRLGFCLLHPMEAAGLDVEVETDDGTIASRFEELITPYDPFKRMKAMRYRLNDGAQVAIQFEGDLFQTEDQRNWTDASFKTFCTPLDLPYPVKVNKGDNIRQAVTVHIDSAVAEALSDVDNDRVRMTVAQAGACGMPKLGTWFADLHKAADQAVVDRLRTLRLSQLRVQLNLLSAGWDNHLRHAAETAARLGVELEIEALVDLREMPIKALCSQLFYERIAVKRLSLFPVGYSEEEKVLTKCDLSGSPYRACQFVTKETMLRHAKRWIDHYRLDIALGGGSRTNFTEFNRAVIPFTLMDYAEYAIQPQTHAFDIESIVETLEAQSLTVRTAQSILAGSSLALRINSVTLKPRVNPYATSDAGAIVTREEQIDARLHSLFGAGWTIGSVRQLASGETVSVNYYEHAGALGIMSEDGAIVYPVYHVLRELGELADADVLPVTFSQPRRIEGMALMQGSRFRILTANLENDEKTVHIRLPFNMASCKLKAMDETNYMDITKHYERLPSTDFTGAHGREVELKMKPFSISVLDGEAML